MSIYAHGPREDKDIFNDYQGVYHDNKLDLDGCVHKRTEGERLEGERAASGDAWFY